ncbi:MAG: glycosyltransferase family 39 protein [Cyanobacteria bacterium J06648_16]
MHQITSKSSSFSRDHLTKNSVFVIWLSLLLGFFLRIHQYIYNRPLWLDEAMLSNNIVNRSFAELLEPLGSRQSAPIPFLLLTRLSVEFFGPNEYALRLPSLIFGLLALVLFYFVATQYISLTVVPPALLIFAISNPLIYYSSEVKQYSGDVMAALICLLMIEKMRQELNSLGSIGVSRS